MIKLEGMSKEYTEHFEKIANNALSQYLINFDKLRFIGYFTNCILLAESGKDKYALRISSPGWRTYTDLYSEAIWLHDLYLSSDIGAVEPIASRDNKFITLASYEGSNTYHCLLMRWLSGYKFSDYINSINIYKMGVMFAKLHNFSEKYNPPADFTKRKMNQIFARNEVVAIYLIENRNCYKQKQYEIIQRTKDRTDDAYKKLYSNNKGLMVISHDLHHDNIIIDESGKLRPFDFEDTCLGYPVQDIAMAMRDLMEDHPENFETYLFDFKKGYNTLRQWPEEYENHIDEFMAGRMLWVANWILLNEEEGFSEHLDWAIPRLENFLNKGKLRYFIP